MLLGYFLCTLTSIVPYWKDPRIHNLGNIGWGGGLHAAIAPAATRIIDKIAFDGRDVRTEALRKLLSKRELVSASGYSILDMCCGVGSSTPDGATGVDSSSKMIAMARHRHKDGCFHVGNAETWGITDNFTITTIMFALHEMPRHGRHAVLKNALRVSTKVVFVLDIDPGYEPSPAMRMGEPFIDGYLDDIEHDIRHLSEKYGLGTTCWNEAPSLKAWLIWSTASCLP